MVKTEEFWSDIIIFYISDLTRNCNNIQGSLFNNVENILKIARKISLEITEIINRLGTRPAYEF